MNPMGVKSFSLFMKYNFKQEWFNTVTKMILKTIIKCSGIKRLPFQEHMSTIVRPTYRQHSLKLKNFKILFVSMSVAPKF